MNVTDENALSTAEELKNLTSNSRLLETEGISKAVEVVENIVTLEQIEVDVSHQWMVCSCNILFVALICYNIINPSVSFKIHTVGAHSSLARVIFLESESNTHTPFVIVVQFHFMLTDVITRPDFDYRV